MSYETTLFAHIAPRLTDRIEDVAVEALGHILSNSEAARSALEETVGLGGAIVGPIDRVQTQVTDEEGARPDLVGFDDKGTKRVLIEAKFWAGLTPNQPNQYLDQLPRGRPAALLFVAPARRIPMLWPKLLRRAEEEFKLTAKSERKKLCSAIVNDGEHRLLLTSWAELLEHVKTRAHSTGDTAAEADIWQLIGLTERMDMDAFLPWPSEEQWGAEFAKRVLSLIPLVDDAISSGKADGFLDNSKTRINLRWEGYGRRIRISGVNAWFGFILDAWAEHGSTPLWLLFSYGDYERLQEAGLAETHVVKWKTSDGRFCIPIALPTEVDYDEVLDSVVASLKCIAEGLKSTGPDTLEDEEREE